MAKKIMLCETRRLTVRVRGVFHGTASCDIISLDGIVYRTEEMSLSDAEDWVLNTSTDFVNCIDELVELDQANAVKHHTVTRGIFVGDYHPTRGVRIYVESEPNRPLFRSNEPDRFMLLRDLSRDIWDNIQEYIDDTLDNL